MRKKLLYLVAEDWYFCSHREELAKAALKKGYEVFVATRVTDHGERIEREGFHLFPIRIKRARLNPFAELRTVLEIVSLYWKVKPDIVHHVALKPVLYGSLAARVAGIPSVVNALAGMGFVFSSASMKAKVLRPFIRFLFKVLLAGRKRRLILQNSDDVSMFVNDRIVPRETVRLIRGSGVDISKFSPSPEPDGVPVVVLPARLLRDKGVCEFVEAARRLRSAGVLGRFVLVGEIDPENPSSLSKHDVKKLTDEGIVECPGWSSDMASVFAEANLVCLPSYREGLPKALLEALACGRAVVTTDVPGCREVVKHKYNGLLVPPRDAGVLADALKSLILQPSVRREMGRRGRMFVETEFSSARVIDETLSVYGELLS